MLVVFLLCFETHMNKIKILCDIEVPQQELLFISTGKTISAITQICYFESKPNRHSYKKKDKMNQNEHGVCKRVYIRTKL